MKGKMDLRNLEEMEKGNIKTVVAGDGSILFDLKEANKKFPASVLKKHISGGILYYDGTLGHVMLKELGLIGYWAIWKE